MRLRSFLLVFALAPWTAALVAQEPAPPQPPESTQEPADEIKRIDCRISATRPGAVVAIDRGTIDGVAVGDRVLFYPKGGGTFEGGVIEVAERLAHLGAAGPLLDRADEFLDHGQRDVGLEQGDADLAGGGVDVRLGEPALAAEVLEGVREAVGERCKQEFVLGWSTGTVEGQE